MNEKQINHLLAIVWGGYGGFGFVNLRLVEHIVRCGAERLDEASSVDPVTASINAVNDFTRLHMRQDSFVRRIMPPMMISDDELDRAVPTDLPVRIMDQEWPSTM